MSAATLEELNEKQGKALAALLSLDRPGLGARLGRARAIIDGAVRAVELQDLTARMEDLERKLAAGRRGAHR